MEPGDRGVDLQRLGRTLLAASALLGLAGLLLLLGGRSGLGSLPGDLRMEGERWSCFFPIVTSIILSIVLTIILNAVFRWFR